MKKKLRRCASITNLGERNLQIRIKIINSFNLSEEIFLKKYFCDRETLFMVCLPSFKKLLREKADIKFISLYLSNLKNFIDLLKAVNEDNNNNNNAKQNNDEKDKYLKVLRYVSEHIIYEKFPSKRLIMRYGDIGDKFYIILHGQVSILIPIRTNFQLTFNEYSRYIAILILYQEYELAKLTMRENKHIYNIDLPDIKFIKYYINMQFDDDTLDSEEKFNKNNYIYVKSNKSAKNVHRQKVTNKASKYTLTKIDEEGTHTRNIGIEKMIESENATKIDNFMGKYLTKEEYRMFEELKLNNNFENDDSEITPQIYIERLKNFQNSIPKKSPTRRKTSNLYHSPSRKSSKKLGFLSREKEKEKEESENYESLQATHNKNIVYIYEYQEVIQLETGLMFGDLALNTSNSKRSATIITIADSYFGCLNKDIYSTIKYSNERKKKNMINYLCHTKIFKSINSKTLEDKYINYFAFKTAVMDEYIIKNGQLNSNLIIIKNGVFEITFNGKLNDVFYLMNYYYEKFSDLNEKKYEMSENLFRKINKLNDNRRKIEKLFGENKDTEYEHKLFIINSSSIFGLKETEKEENNKFISFYNIKCISSEGDYVLLDKKIFYRQIYLPEFKVKEETKLYIKEFAEKSINRLIHVLYAKIWNILNRNDMKAYKNIKSLSITPELKKSNKKNNLMHEIGLDFYFMNRYNLTDIEWIIESILNKYNEDAFDNRNLASNIFNYLENKRITSIQEKNIIKLEEEKYDPNKIISSLKNLKNREKKHYTRLFNFQKHSSFIKSPKNVFNNTNKNNDDTSKLIPYKNNNLKLTKNILTPHKPNTIKYKLDKSFSSLVDERKTCLSPNNKSARNHFVKKDSYYFKSKINISKNCSSGLSQGKTMDSFISDVSVNCNYVNFNNACISKLNYNIIKDNSMNDYKIKNFNNEIKLKNNNSIEDEMNKLFGGNERYQSIYNRCFSARHNSNSKINIFDSSQSSKEFYSCLRKEYVLKNTRSLFTRNKNFVQYKRRKKKVDKNV